MLLPTSHMHKPAGSHGVVIASLMLWLAAFAPDRAYAAASVPPPPSTIHVDNSSPDTQDQVTVTRLRSGDVVKVYADAGASMPLGIATVAGGSSSATVDVGQLGSASGHIFVTGTQPSYSESRRIVKSFSAEPTSLPLLLAPSALLALGQVSITNAFNGTGDSVLVTGVRAGDIMRVYTSERAAAPIAQATVHAGQDSAVASLPQLGAGEGTVYVSVTSPPLLESARVAKHYSQEPVTASPFPRHYHCDQ
ncbi:hypothetical protein [Paenibacillus xerothermodurans]|uniref:Uncharacterized protein n=1 Tax=Paenibacillus xerothermodurans TaxID=1977292 RepID=A0A2W1NMJ8_PAEXE|nr:hypothetical protein [Paenibacillus xerothermodurans]PZE20685.1 hypothetical protein CBW46_010935 [Paenibacillus xerothermodurans]